MLFKVLCITLLASWSIAHEIRTHNRCPFTVWVGTLGNANKPAPEGGGYQLNQWQTRSVFVSRGWGGRIWGRTNCNGAGHCETGDCGNRIQCNGAGGIPPVTLAEFTFDGWGNQDYYDVSLVDGYNLPMQIRPIAGTFRREGGGKYDCNVAGCNADLNARCPNELAIRNSGGWPVACKSACMHFNTDEYCCRGAHNTPQTCKSSMWPRNYPQIFKSACPDAYSYAYDDTSSTFTCHGNPESGYEVVFCP